MYAACFAIAQCHVRRGMACILSILTETAEAEVECHLRLKKKGEQASKKNMKNINVNISKRTLVTHIGRIG